MGTQDILFSRERIILKAPVNNILPEKDIKMFLFIIFSNSTVFPLAYNFNAEITMTTL